MSRVDSTIKQLVSRKLQRSGEPEMTKIQLKKQLSATPKERNPSSGGIVSFKEFSDTLMAVGRGEMPAPEWAGKTVYASEKAKEFWSAGSNERTVAKAKSLSAFARLIDENRDLLSAIGGKHHWDSVAEVATAIGRAEPNVSRSLSKLERYGVVSLVPGAGKKKRPEISSRRLSFQVDVVTGDVLLIEEEQAAAKRSPAKTAPAAAAPSRRQAKSLSRKTRHISTQGSDKTR